MADLSTTVRPDVEADGVVVRSKGRFNRQTAHQVSASRTEALGAAAVRAGQQRVELHVRRNEAAPTLARAAVGAACDRWCLEDLRTSAQLIVSELVTNAVRHAVGDIGVEAVLRGDFLHLRVHDGSPEPPVPVRSDASIMRDSGRGLPIVAKYSSAWGFIVNQSQSGKVVWATLRACPRDT